MRRRGWRSSPRSSFRSRTIFRKYPRIMGDRKWTIKYIGSRLIRVSWVSMVCLSKMWLSQINYWGLQKDRNSTRSSSFKNMMLKWPESWLWWTISKLNSKLWSSSTNWWWQPSVTYHNFTKTTRGSPSTLKYSPTFQNCMGPNQFWQIQISRKCTLC